MKHLKTYVRINNHDENIYHNSHCRLVLQNIENIPECMKFRWCGICDPNYRLVDGYYGDLISLDKQVHDTLQEHHIEDPCINIDYKQKMNNLEKQLEILFDMHD